MSHFTVAVITDGKPEDELLEAILQPWHEYECTGHVDEYVVFVPGDQDEIQEEYEKYYKGEGEGQFSSFDDFITVHYKREGDEIGRMTNPNAKWDWWQVGGRWSGIMRVKPGSEGAEKGRPGLMGSEYDPNGVDICRVGDLDWEGMKAEAVRRRRDSVEACINKIWDANKCFETRDEVLAAWYEYTAELGSLDLRNRFDKLPREGRPSYNEWAPTVMSEKTAAAWNRSKDSVAALSHYFEGPNIPIDVKDVDAWIENIPAFCTFALIKGGEWYARGEMSWWACVSGEKDEWDEEFGNLIESLGDDQWITVVDCHI